LNGIRFVVQDGRPVPCTNHVLADANRCRECLLRNGTQVGALHLAERALSGAPDGAYVEDLRRALGEAAGVLVNNLSWRYCWPLAHPG
jgi:hypothetical protein